MSTTPQQKKDINTAIQQVAPFETAMNDVIDLVKKYNTDTLLTIQASDI